MGNLSDTRPISYQETDWGEREEIETAYLVDQRGMSGTQVYGFDIRSYDSSRTLWIDPAVVVYAGYLGGGGDNIAYGIAVDSAGNAYVTGETITPNSGFPDGDGVGPLASPDPTYNGGLDDAFVAKVNAEGTALVYAGYLGGNEEEIGFDIAVDGAGNAYVVGYTTSTEASFPTGDGLGCTLESGSHLQRLSRRVRGQGKRSGHGLGLCRLYRR